jgi:hypothetical protein
MLRRFLPCAVIPLGNLATIKKELSRIISEEQRNKPEIVIPQEIQQLKPGKMPAGARNSRNGIFIGGRHK